MSATRSACVQQRSPTAQRMAESFFDRSLLLQGISLGTSKPLMVQSARTRNSTPVGLWNLVVARRFQSEPHDAGRPVKASFGFLQDALCDGQAGLPRPDLLFALAFDANVTREQREMCRFRRCDLHSGIGAGQRSRQCRPRLHVPRT